MSPQGTVFWDRLLLLTLPSSTILIRFFITRFNVRQTLPTEKHPILQIIVSTPIQHFLCVLTPMTVLGSCSHKNTPCFRINLTVRHELQSVPLFPLCSNLLHLSITHKFQSFIYKCVYGCCSPIQLFHLQTIHPKVVVNSCGVIVSYLHSLFSFSEFSVGLEDCNKRPK